MRAQVAVTDQTLIGCPMRPNSETERHVGPEMPQFLSAAAPGARPRSSLVSMHPDCKCGPTVIGVESLTERLAATSYARVNLPLPRHWGWGFLPIAQSPDGTTSTWRRIWHRARGDTPTQPMF